MSSAAPQTAAALTLNQQYIKDLSFEVPGAPEVFMSPPAQPTVKVTLDVQARRLSEDQPHFEVGLQVRVETSEAPAESTAKGKGATAAPAPGRQLFIAELLYAGLFTLGGIPPQQIEPVLLIECPRLLFPFARNIIADVTRDGGFPPVLLQPVDFLALWQNRQAQQGATRQS